VAGATVVGFDVAGWRAVGWDRAARPAFPAAPGRERVSVLDRALAIHPSVAAIERQETQLLEPPEDSTHRPRL
jgi:hypothetical protein